MEKLSEKQRQYVKWGLWIFLVLLVYFSINWIFAQVMAALQANPNVWSFYKTIEYEIQSRSLLGLFIGCTMGATFLIGIPVEAAFLFYLGLDYPLFKVFAIALAGILLGALFNYGVGALIGPRPVKALLKEKYGSFSRKVDRAGAFFVILGNILPPFPGDLFALFLGTVRYNFLKLLFYTTIGRVIQFFLLWLGYKYIFLSVAPYMSVFSYDWFVQLIRSSFGG